MHVKLISIGFSTFLFQVHYDVGGIFFHQGCTDQTAYQKARDHFRQTKDLLKKVLLKFCVKSRLNCINTVYFCTFIFQLDSTVHVHLDEKRLAGYWNACKALTEDCDSDSQTTAYDQINSLIRAHNYQVRIAAVICLLIICL